MCEMTKHTNTHDTLAVLCDQVCALPLRHARFLPDTGSVWENNMLTGQDSWIWGRHHLTINQ